jgi:hypothetical protein
MSQPVTIAYAFGASDWTYVDEQKAFEENLKGVFDFKGIDWRPALPAAPAYYLRFMHDRAPDRACGAGSGESAIAIDDAPFPTPAERAADQAEFAALEGGRAAEIKIEGFPFDRRIMGAAYRNVMGHSGLTIADALRFVANPGPPTDLAARRLEVINSEARGRPVVAIGLSLGGLILVSALRSLKEQGKTPVSLLITIGSQAAALRAFGVLPGAGPDVAEPALFTPWLNIWHEHDYLSYPIGAILQNLDDACDRRAHQDGAFPWVHSKYLTPQSGAFDYIREEISNRFPG